MTVAMDNIPQLQIPRATALSNVLRQLVGAFGTAIFASVLLDRTRLHEAALTQVVTPTSPAAVHLLSATELAMRARGLSDSVAHSAGLMALERMVQVAATVRAFDDCFRIATFAALLGILPALLLRQKKRPPAGAHREAVVEMG
jgi:hypothetical protein